VRQQDTHVLDRGDKVILNLLAPEPSPTRSLEVMVISGIGKTLFHQLLSALSISPRGVTVGLPPRYIEGCLFFVAFDRAPELRSGALRPQKTCGAGSAARLILHGVAHPMQSPRL
jgi:hypothetical protein